MNALESLKELVSDFAKDRGYINYLKVRDNVLAMMALPTKDDSIPSSYWSEELEGFDYMLDASPLIVRKLREHCYHITGLRSYEYRHHHAHKARAFANKLEALRGEDKNDLFLPEERELGGFGHNIDGQLVNIDTLKFYESLIAMDHGELLQNLQSQVSNGKRPIVVEIGGGWGGFGYQIKKIVPEITYVIIDLPQTLLFSATYLKTLFPQAVVFMYGESDLDDAMTNLERYDFVFLPHYFVDDHQLPRIDLAVNMISFQEMTTGQVSGYIKWLWESECPQVYSYNRGRSPHNSQLSNVPDLLRYGYGLQEINVLPVPYTVLNVPATGDPVEKVVLPKDAKAIARHMLSNALRSVKKKAVGPSSTDYRHMIGKRKLEFRGTGK